MNYLYKWGTTRTVRMTLLCKMSRGRYYYSFNSHMRVDSKAEKVNMRLIPHQHCGNESRRGCKSEMKS